MTEEHARYNQIKRRVKADFDVSCRYELHQDAIAALDRIVELLPDTPRYKLVTFAILNLEKTIIDKDIKNTDDLEERLDLLTE